MWKNVLKNQREKRNSRFDRSLFYLGNTTKTEWRDDKVGEVRMRVKKSQAAKQISTHLTYNNLPHHKLLRMKNR